LYNKFVFLLRSAFNAILYVNVRELRFDFFRFSYWLNDKHILIHIKVGTLWHLFTNKKYILKIPIKFGLTDPIIDTTTIAILPHNSIVA
jgi:hypothetical protein